MPGPVLRDRKKVFITDVKSHMGEAKLVGRGAQILFSGRGVIKICSRRGKKKCPGTGYGSKIFLVKK